MWNSRRLILGFLLGASAARLAAPATAATYKLTHLGAITPGGSDVQSIDRRARAVNNNGRCVGGMSIIPTATRAYMWDPPGPMSNLTPNEQNFSFADGVNTSGNIALTVSANIVGGSRRAVFWDSATAEFTIIGPTSSEASDVNDSNQVVGYAGQAFLWSPSSGFVNLGTLPNTSTSKTWAINNSGAVVGNTDPFGNQPSGFFWKPVDPNGTTGAMVNVGSFYPADPECVAYGINDAETVVGWTRYNSAQTHHVAFRWTLSGGMVSLGHLGAGTLSEAYGISNAGVIVGKSTTNGSTTITERAFIWNPTIGTMVDLNNLFTPDQLSLAGFVNLRQAWGISPNGRFITGWGNTATSGTWLMPFLIEICDDVIGDMNCDCTVSAADVSSFVQALLDPDAYEVAHPDCDILKGDMQPDGVVDGADVQGFVDLLIP